MRHRWILLAAGITSTLFVGAAGAIALAVATVYPRLPSLETLTDYRPKIPLRVYTFDGVQIGEFGEEKRDFVAIGTVPQLMKQAILAAEDERFYQHGGVDYIGVARAALSNLLQGHAQSGASTITMQVARNFFLSSEKTFTRKFNEALLSFKIEHNLSKDQILELYFNQIYLGQRAYGFSSAAQVYFGKSLNQLSPAEMAMLAGLPKAPSSYNPVVNPARAKLRQQYVLRRMHELRFLDAAQYQSATQEQLNVRKTSESFSVAADYVAEMARQVVVEKYPDTAYTQGFNIYTTLISGRQSAAYEAARKGVLDYDRRHGYRGPEGFLNADQARLNDPEWLEEQLADVKDAGSLRPAVIRSVGTGSIRLYVKGGAIVEIKGKALQFISRSLSKKLPPNQQLRPGALVRTYLSGSDWQIGQLPQVEVALVSLDPTNGAIQALVGGFDFNRNNFNRVTQAWRQPGSSFKPFVYSAGIERGITAATVINDAPLVVDPASVGGQQWEPKNFDGTFDGPLTVRSALTKSKNLVSIRLLQAISPEYAQAYISKFGFEARHHPPYLTMALGAGSVTPLQLAEGYAVFANGGYRIRSYFIDRIEDAKGRVLAKTQPETAGKDAPRTLDVRNAFIMTSMMRDVTRFGTAAKANVLNRSDIAGKTGTTNDSHDAWFAGYQATLVSVAWLGFDQPRSLGGSETGGQAALPIWIHYMASALKDVPESRLATPDGVITRTVEGSKGPREEYFYAEFPETNPELALENVASSPQSIEDGVKDLLF